MRGSNACHRPCAGEVRSLPGATLLRLSVNSPSCERTLIAVCPIGVKDHVAVRGRAQLVEDQLSLRVLRFLLRDPTLRVRVAILKRIRAQSEWIAEIHRVPARVSVQIEPAREPDRVFLRGIERSAGTPDKGRGTEALPTRRGLLPALLPPAVDPPWQRAALGENRARNPRNPLDAFSRSRMSALLTLPWPIRCAGRIDRSPAQIRRHSRMHNTTTLDELGDSPSLGISASHYDGALRLSPSLAICRRRIARNISIAAGTTLAPRKNPALLVPTST